MDTIQHLLEAAQTQLDFCENCTKPHPAYKGSLHLAIQKCIEALKLLTTQKIERPTIKEKLLHSWPVCDEYGWRMINLVQQGEMLVLYAYNHDGDEVDPNIEGDK